MHLYVIDSEERKKIPFYIAAFSILLGYILHNVLSYYNLQLWWLEIPSPFGFYEILYKLFDNYFWKCEKIKKFIRIKTPNISGEWEGTIKSSYDNFLKETKAKILIKQTWTKISIKYVTDSSLSYSETACLYIDKECDISLRYEYFNKPNSDTVESMHKHYGYASLIIDNKLEKMSGDYFSDFDRKNYGTIKLKKVKVFITDKPKQKDR